jgi:hypothetical protein
VSENYLACIVITDLQRIKKCLKKGSTVFYYLLDEIICFIKGVLRNSTSEERMLQKVTRNLVGVRTQKEETIKLLNRGWRKQRNE